MQTKIHLFTESANFFCGHIRKILQKTDLYQLYFFGYLKIMAMIANTPMVSG